MFKRFLLCICLSITCFASIFGGKISVSAEEEPVPTPTEEEIVAMYESGYEVTSGHITDNNLYSILLKMAEKDIKDKYNIDYDFETIYSEMFKHFTEIDINDNIITTLTGLDLVKFDNLKTLKVTNNKLTYISSDIFENMPVIENLDFTSNNISSVNLGAIPTLKTLNLNNNKLSILNLSDLGATSIDVSVAQNSFSTMLGIIFPERVTEISLNIINNKIMDIPDDYLTMEKLKLSVGIQGVNENNKMVLNTVTPIKYYKTNNPELSLKVFKYNGVLGELYHTFKDEDILNNTKYIEKSFPIGEYYFEYYLNDSPAYVKNDRSYSYYKCGELSVKPTICDVKYEFKGEVYDTFDDKVTGKVKVMLSSVDNGTIMYRINSGEWQAGDTVMCDKGGNYSIYAKVVVDGVESDERVILVRTSQNVLIPDFVMLILILLFTLGLFMVVVPLVSKKFFKK